MNKNIPTNHISQKKKNTYIVDFNIMIDIGLFAHCKTTPVPVTHINGQEINTSMGFKRAHQFPNPQANDMFVFHDIYDKPQDKTSSTIIEYLDKHTMQPVVYVFPNDIYVCTENKSDFLQHLNHATKRDFIRQLQTRKLINEK